MGIFRIVAIINDHFYTILIIFGIITVILGLIIDRWVHWIFKKNLKKWEHEHPNDETKPYIRFHK